MKKVITLGILLIPFLLLAQTIPSYYNDVNLNLTGTSLKNELATKIISTHTRHLSYSNIWSASKITDLDPTNSANVILVYGYNDNDGVSKTDRTRSKNRNGGGATDWNREHSYAKSLGTPNLGTSGPGSDAHHLRPADVRFNGQRGSKKFVNGNGNAGDRAGGWYPGDEWKGDIARMMMYMYLRYGNRCKPTGVGIGSSSATPDSMIDLFLTWNAQDPVSNFEKNRNTYHGNSSNTYAQGNRNPFIDNPAFATQIWGGPQAEDLFGGGGSSDTQAPTVPASLSAANTTQTSTTLSWNASSDNVGVTGYKVYRNGVLVTTTTVTTYNATGLTATTTYTFNVKAEDAAGNVSANSNTATVTTQSSGGGGGGASELFFSEYIEGSSYNKALEIANFTGSTVSLASYKIKKQSNGSGAWSSGISLSGQLANNAIFVVANGNASSTIIAVADETSTGSELSFNGNDPIGLFKNGVLIDIIGTFSAGSANFAKDKTLRRKQAVISPSTTFDKSGEWDIFAKNTFNGLGSHTTSGGGGGSTTEVLLEDSFETGWNGWADGGGDCYRIRSAAKAYDGSYSIRIRDNSGTASAMTSPTFNISAYDNLEITFNFYSYSMEYNEDFWVRYYDGSTWRTIKAFKRGTDFNNNSFTAATVNISSASYNFPSNAKFRFQCDASSNADQIYIDNVKITATSGAAKFTSSSTKRLDKETENTTNTPIEIEGMHISPNPTSTNSKVTIMAELDIEDNTTDVTLNIVNIQGQLIQSMKFNDVKNEVFKQELNISTIKNGVYFVNITTTNGFSTIKKLVIK